MPPRGQTLEERLTYKGWQVTENGCWEWLGTRHNKKGYGEIYHGGKTWLAHRASFAVWGAEPIISDLHVLHACDNPPCINPEHLFQGTNADNVADKLSKGRQRHLVGEEHPRAKITAETAMKIFNDTGTSQELAAKYGVNSGTVYFIKTKQQWKSIHGGS